MNRNIKITIGLSLASIVAATILLLCKKQLGTCCAGSGPIKEACCKTNDQPLQEDKAKQA